MHRGSQPRQRSCASCPASSAAPDQHDASRKTMARRVKKARVPGYSSTCSPAQASIPPAAEVHYIVEPQLFEALKAERADRELYRKAASRLADKLRAVEVDIDRFARQASAFGPGKDIAAPESQAFGLASWQKGAWLRLVSPAARCTGARPRWVRRRRMQRSNSGSTALRVSSSAWRCRASRCAITWNERPSTPLRTPQE
jgi:hypothetical protein